MAIVFNNLSAGGSKLYEHNLYFYGSGLEYDYFTTKFITQSAEPFNKDTFATWLSNNGFTSDGFETNHFPVNGYRMGSSAIWFIISIYNMNGSIKTRILKMGIDTKTINEENIKTIGTLSTGSSSSLSNGTLIDYVKEL